VVRDNIGLVIARAAPRCLVSEVARLSFSYAAVCCVVERSLCIHLLAVSLLVRRDVAAFVQRWLFLFLVLDDFHWIQDGDKKQDRSHHRAVSLFRGALGMGAADG